MFAGAGKATLWALLLALLMLWLGCRERSGSVRLVFSADSRGALADGGLARRATMLRRLRLDGGSPLLLIEGGNLHAPVAAPEAGRGSPPLPPGVTRPPSRVSSADRNAVEHVRLLGLMQYDLAVLGPLDGGLEEETLKSLMRDSGFHWLGGAWRDGRRRLGLDTVYVAQRGGLAVGILDQLDPAWPANGLDSSQVDHGLLRRARALRPWVDLLVVVAAQEPSRVEDLARSLEGLADLLLLTGLEGGPPLSRRVGGVLVAGVGGEGRNLGLLDVDVRKGRLLKAEWSLLPLDEGVAEDPAVAGAVERQLERERGLERGRLEQLRQELLRKLDLSAAELPGENAVTWYQGGTACRDCHQEQWEAWQSSAHGRVWDELLRDKAISDVPRVRRSVTGWLEKGGWLNDRETPGLSGVRCEACHGRASSHVFTRGTSFKGMGEEPAGACLACHATPPRVDPHSLLALPSAP